MIFRYSWLLCCSLLIPSIATAESRISIQGEVAKPGTYSLPAGARLNDVLLPAQVSPSAYMLGAAWLHEPLRKSQKNLKVGILFDLATLKSNAILDEQVELAALAARLSARVQSMPVTARRSAELDPVRVELNRGNNSYLSNGDILLYPSRPNTIKITGAVVVDCELPHQPLQSAINYLKHCPRDLGADIDMLFVIQPNGKVFQEGIALWNRTVPIPPAPGAVIYVPIHSSSLGDTTPDLNSELAAFIATQPMLEAKQ